MRLHAFATVVGLMLVSLMRVALGTSQSARGMMRRLGEIEATTVRVRTKNQGRREGVLIPPELKVEQRRWVEKMELGRWMPAILSSSAASPPRDDEQPTA
ncbi:MAG: hypothetical protein IT166_18405 [Bryobacterales bacterium]|nr:hypothetical protein [Bryobacterales bacterium]